MHLGFEFVIIGEESGGRIVHLGVWSAVMYVIPVLRTRSAQTQGMINRERERASEREREREKKIETPFVSLTDKAIIVGTLLAILVHNRVFADGLSCPPAHGPMQ